MHLCIGLPFFSLKKRANTKLCEKLPSNLKIAKLSVSYSNYFFNLFFNFNLVQNNLNIREVLFFLHSQIVTFPKIIK